MTHTSIKSRIDGGILFVSIDRAEKRNALTPEMVFAISEAVQAADDDPQIRAVIVYGEGPMFSAGVDVAALGESLRGGGSRNPARWLRRLTNRLQEALNLLEATELPIIGALHGQVMGLGLELALAFDLRVAAQDCQLSIPEARVGLVADVGGTTRLARTIGPARAKDMLLTARSVSADEALAWGLINRVVPRADLLSSASGLAGEITKNAPLAIGLAKLIVDQGDGTPKSTQMAIERWAQSQLISTGDVMEAFQSFVEKRAQIFMASDVAHAPPGLSRDSGSNHDS